MTWLREVSVYYFDTENEEKVDEFKVASTSYDEHGWLVVTLDDGRGVFRYPPSRVVKVREYGGRP
jgi:hypothetical protein